MRLFIPSRPWLYAALVLAPLAFDSYASDDDDDDGDDEFEVHEKAVAPLLRPEGGPAPEAKGKIEVEKEELDEQEIEFEAEHLLAGHSYSLYLEDAPGSGNLVDVGAMATDDEDDDFALESSGDDGDDGDDGGDDDDSDEDDGDDDDGDDDDGAEAELKFKLKHGVGFLPFSVADVELLAGSRAEVRDELGTVYLYGVVPSLVGDFSPDQAKTSLDLVGAGDAAKGRLSVKSAPKKAKDEFELKVKDMAGLAGVTLGIEDPVTHGLTAVATIPLKGNGSGRLRLRTKKGDPLPFGVTSVKELGGLNLEVRDPATSEILMTGVIPQL